MKSSLSEGNWGISGRCGSVDVDFDKGPSSGDAPVEFLTGPPISGLQGWMRRDRESESLACAAELRNNLQSYLFDFASLVSSTTATAPCNACAENLRKMSDEPRPRSRFDRDESDRPPRSRFDRRSRSPSSREPESRRTRSPVGREPSDSPANAEKSAKVTGAAAAAAAAAARINAQIQAKKGIQHVDVPPIRAVCSTDYVCWKIY